MVDSNKKFNEKYLTPAELNSLTKDLLKLSCKIESFVKD